MTPKVDPSDLRRRREEIGASIATMAAGVGLAPDVVISIEGGMAPPALREQYVQWLSVLEALTADRRMAEIYAASEGRRFSITLPAQGSLAEPAD